MTDLAARSPAEGRLPLTIGTLTLEECAPATITSVMPLRGWTGTLPAPNRTTTEGGTRTVWAGLNQWFVVGDAPDGPDAALTDQSDAWGRYRLSGADVEAALARLTPLDMRAAKFAPGHCARTLLGHMDALLIREDAETVEIWTFRSMAATTVHEVERALRGVAARAALDS